MGWEDASMKPHRNYVNVLPLLIYILIIVLFALLPILAFADGIGKIAPVEHLTPKELRAAEIIIQRERPGALLPWKTFQTDDTPRPQYWNGFGVDPSESNYWYYWKESTECLKGYADVWEGTDHCEQLKEAEQERIKAVPEPDGMLVFGLALCFVWFLARRRA